MQTSISSQILPETGASIGRYTNAQHYKDGLFSEVFKASSPGDEQKAGNAPIVALKNHHTLHDDAPA